MLNLRQMKAYLAIIILAVLFTDAKCAEDNEMAGCVSSHVEQLKELVDGERWSISVADSTITVESKFEVEYFPFAVSLGSPLPKTKYRFSLSFAPNMPKEKFAEIYKARLDSLLVLRYGAKTKTEYNDARQFLINNPLPKFAAWGKAGHKYSVYFKSTEDEVSRIGTIETYKEVKAIEAMIHHVFWNQAD